VNAPELVILEPISAVYAIACPYCLRPERERCVTASGKLRTAHVARWDRANRLWRTREMWHMLRADDSRFGLAAGDIVRTLRYPWDTKVSVLFRESDGFEPECSQYLRDVAFLGFVPLDMEMRR
jgi:hypothetical protein